MVVYLCNVFISYLFEFFICSMSFACLFSCFFFFKQKTAYEMLRSLVGSEMCIRDSLLPTSPSSTINAVSASTNFSRGVIIVDVRRMDPNPVSSVDGRVTLLPGGFMCTTSTPNNNNIVGMPWVNIALDAPLPPLTIAEQQAVAVVSAISPGMQTVAAMTLLRCSPGNTATVETETTIRALVPVALSGTCAGAVQGAILAISMVGAVSYTHLTLPTKRIV
eukprot:TRINITY_DN32092_c0_g1_i1.p1 TRINITY_DN32092_c0_g1~~TRINITY_DN32092_c0_g1_i1.p1  ORF type:complete len:220 (-),score=45.26 TRINITY_DN32092_c0_g1_i1:120-779(-)